MKLNVIQNAKKGISFGIINRIITLIVPFILQTLIRWALSAEYIGIRGLFDSILTVLSLAELGMGSAIVYHMYKPIAEDNTAEIEALLKLYQKIYFLVGLIVLVVGCVLTPFVPYLINGDYPKEISLRVVFFLYVINSAFSYWFFAYRSSLLLAYQRVDIFNNINTVITFVFGIVQALILVISKNYYLFLVITIFTTIVRNISSAYVSKRVFPTIRCVGKVSSDTISSIKKGVFGIFIGNVCGITRNTFDSIFITYFINLNETIKYSAYFFVLSALNQFSGAILSALLAGVGNQIKLNDKQTNFSNMMRINSLYMVLGGWMSTCFLCLIQPFVSLWMGKEYVFPFYTAVLFPIYFYVSKLGEIRGVYADAAGLFWENRVRCYIEIVANFLLNILFIRLFGTFGIILATIITLFFIGFLGSTFVLFRYYFESGLQEYLFKQLYYTIVTIIIAYVCYLICTILSPNSDLQSILVRLPVVLLLPPMLYFVLLYKDSFFIESLYFFGRNKN